MFQCIPYLTLSQVQYPGNVEFCFHQYCVYIYIYIYIKEVLQPQWGVHGGVNDYTDLLYMVDIVSSLPKMILHRTFMRTGPIDRWTSHVAMLPDRKRPSINHDLRRHCSN